jgi:glycogen debranching enzyme
MEEHSNISGNFYVVATSGQADQRNRIIKHSDTMAVFDVYGDICQGDASPQGLYHQGTRFLSHYGLMIEGKRLLLLSSDITRDNHLITVDLTNPDLIFGPDMLHRGSLHIFRSKFIWEGKCFEKYRFRNYGLNPVSLVFQLIFDADFADIFEVRGLKRRQKGKYNPPRLSENMLEFSYIGLDGMLRRTRIDFSGQPEAVHSNGADYQVSLGVNEELEFHVTISCLGADDGPLPVSPYEEAYASASAFLEKSARGECFISTSNDQFNVLFERSNSDLRMLLTNEGDVMYPYAGIPWFCTPFGRDGLIVALQTLWIFPEIARDVLTYLAAHQSTFSNDIQDAEPGKILHEVRMGEMVNCGELPFHKYFGSADSTPMFVMLAGKYLRRTGDIAFIRSLWPNIENSLKWINHYGDMDKDGFVEYERRSEHGIDNQAWKDSSDSVYHEDGTLAEVPIAICEIQAYVYAAKKEAAFLAEKMNNPAMAAAMRQEAEEMRQRFEENFWDDSMGAYVIALDARKKPCRIYASNMGHTLFAEISSPERAQKIGKLLMGSAFFSGWGIRTVAGEQSRYNPMSYHNGSVWPHDNALIAEGFSKYGLNHYAAEILDATFQMSQYTELNRIPELFCGFGRRKNQGPTLYPVACSPQAWSAASVFLLLKACLGLHINAVQKNIRFSTPCLPESLKSVKVHNLEVGEASIDFLAIRHKKDVSIRVTRRSGNLRVSIET